MKKIFTLIAMAVIAIGASAQTEWRPSEEAPAAGSSIIKGDLLKVSTVFETTCGKIMDEGGEPAPVTFGGKTFETYMQIRVDKAPTADIPTGTEKDGSTPLVITAKKNVDLTIYYRRQAADGAYNENDGKDMKLIDQSKKPTLSGLVVLLVVSMVLTMLKERVLVLVKRPQLVEHSSCLSMA